MPSIGVQRAGPPPLGQNSQRHPKSGGCSRCMERLSAVASTTFKLAQPDWTSPCWPSLWRNGQPFGTSYGASTTKLTVDQLPPHTHPLYREHTEPRHHSPAGALSPTFPAAGKVLCGSRRKGRHAEWQRALSARRVANLPVPLKSPSLSLNWCVATTGNYPTRP